MRPELGVWHSPPSPPRPQAKYALLARGDADIYLRFPPADYNEKARQGSHTTETGGPRARLPASPSC